MNGITVTMPIEEFNRLKATEKQAVEFHIKYNLMREAHRIIIDGRDPTDFLLGHNYKLEFKNNEYHLTIKTK